MIDIREYFGVPILKVDFEGETLNLIQDEISKVIPEVKKLNLDNPWGDTVHTTFKYRKRNRDIETFKLDNLKTEIFKLTGMMYPYYNFTLSESWFNFSYKNNFQFDHTHGTEKLSGVYYYQTNGQDGDIKFTTPNIYEKLRLGLSRGTETVSGQPKVGRLLIFPGYLEHRVEPNLTDSERISLTFNLD